MSEKRIYGIDLGTTYSCIAVVNDYGKPEILNNAEGYPITPSVVYFENADNIVVGEAAKNSSKLYPEHTVSLIKREMGNPHFDKEVHGSSYRPEEISSFILRKLVKDASDLRGGEPVTDVIITCPAYFGINEREATKAAGELAGLKVHYVINEPTAAAFFYGLEKAGDQTVLVYDLGGGTFDVTLIEVLGGTVQVVYTDGNHTLGGKDWDDALVNYLADCFVAEYSDKGDPRDDPESLQQLILDAEETKRMLSSKEKMICLVQHNFARAKVEVTREKYDELTASLLEQTVALTQRVLEEGGKRGYPNVDRVLLVGGSSMMPQVGKRLEAEFGLPLEMFEPNLAVAKGAALIGAKALAEELIDEEIRRLTGANITGVGTEEAVPIDRTQVDESTLEEAFNNAARENRLSLSPSKFKEIVNTQLRDVCSKGFGIVVWDGTREVVAFLIHNNTGVPSTITQQFGTQDANQETVSVRIMEQAGQIESPELADNKLVTEGDIVGLPSGLPAGSPISVTFHLEPDGRLTVTAIEPQSGKSLQLEARLEGVMTREEIAAKKGLLLRKDVS